MFKSKANKKNGLDFELGLDAYIYNILYKIRILLFSEKIYV